MMTRRVVGAIVLWWIALGVVACGTGEPRDGRSESALRAPVDAPPASLAPNGTDARPLLVVLGDSLTAGLGLAPEEAYPALLQKRLDQAAIGLRVVNAGVSGDTSAGGLSRLDLALAGDVRVLIVALGANDGLRAVPVEELERNLSTILARARERKIATLLAGMEAPPNLGRDYSDAFREVYPMLAARYRVARMPFLLDGVAGVSALNQPDGIHPTAEGARIIANRLWPLVEPLARSAVRG